MNDFRYALRTLANSPGFTVIAVLTLALGIGPNTAIFSLVYGVLLKPLPYPESDRLVGLAETYQGNRSELDVTYDEFRYLEDHNLVFQRLAVSTEVGFSVFTGDIAERVNGLRVSKDFFATLGVRPALGREFLAEEDQMGGASVGILSHGYWTRRFGGDPGVVGRAIALDGRPTTIVGVMPASFRWLSPVDVWSTMGQVARSIGGGENLHFVGRLPRVSYDPAHARMQAVMAGFRQEFKPRLPPDVGEQLFPLRQLVVGAIATPVRVLFGAIVLVLLIACANLANLLLGRAAARGRELAVRLALGASRARLVRQILTESVLLALAGGALGLILADGALRALLTLRPENLTPPTEIHLDRWALLFTAVTSICVGIVFGLVPAWQARTADPHEGLRAGTGRATSGAATGRLRGALVVSESALSLILLVGAGLLLRTVANLTRTDAGFDPRRVIAAEIWITGSRYDSTAAMAAFYDRLRERLEESPGVRSAAVIEAGIPLERRAGNLAVAVDGKYPGPTSYRTVTPRYFETMAIPLRRGRDFSPGDVQAAEPVAIVSASFAERYLGGDGLGRMVTVGGGSAAPRRVVGVVGDTKQFIGAPVTPTAYVPSAQTPAGFTRLFNSWFPIHVVVRTAGGPAALKEFVARTIRATDARVPLGRVRTMEEILSASLAFHRFLMLLLVAFAGLAVALAAVGIYGVMSYLVTQATREIGVRIALGAQPRQVRGVVIGHGMLLAGLGAIVGVAGSLALTRLLVSQLYGVTPTDALTLGGVTALLLLVAMAACVIPARRATRVDPMVALRYE